MIRLLALFCLLPAATWAQPRVMTDIAPVHSLTAQVMAGVGTPDLLLPPGADPHHFSLRPSDAQRLGDAQVVIWVGEGLTPWLAKPLETLATDATQVALLETDGWPALEIRDLSNAKDDGHDHGHDHDHGHAGGVDPHGWLDPVVAGHWLDSIAATLAAADPANAATYASNAAAAKATLTTLEAEIAADLAPFSGRGYILPHDGYAYFEARFGLSGAGAITANDASSPGPAHLANLRDRIADGAVSCVFADAETGPRLTALVAEDSSVGTAMLDATGASLPAGAGLYPALLRQMATAFATCLAAGDPVR